MQIAGTAFLFVSLTVSLYFILNIVYVKHRNPFLIPMVTTTFAIIIILLIFQVEYETYMIGGKWIDILLGPAIVSLAVPLYKERALLKKLLVPVLGGIAAVGFVGMASGVLFAKMFRFSEEIMLTILPKSITTPIAMEITKELGGIPALAVVFVITAGIAGMMFGPAFLHKTGIHTPIGRGMGLGVAAHALGTSKALEMGEQEASISSVAMILAAIFGSVASPFIMWIF